MGKKDKSSSGEDHGKHGGADAAENIKVIVRCRPLSTKEVDCGYKSCVDLDLSDNTVTVHTLCGNPDRWTFDAVVNNTFSQRDVFTQFIRPMVDSVLEGFNATVFAYGQSGSGKTHTMTGKMGDEELEGIIPRTFSYIFSMLRQFQDTAPNKRFSLYVSFIELYNGKVRDLLAKQQVPLAVKENKDKTFYVQGSFIPQVKTPEDIFQLMEEGTERRQVAATELNADSSRSHSIFTLVIECTETTDDGDVRSVTSKLNLVDLAGSERQSKTGATGDTLKEGCNINLSLSALGTVIDTLVKGRGHVPFRSSPLTMLLKDSLGGSSKTAMFANIGPSEHNISETISTLRFADRAKQIKNKPVVNMDTKDQKIAELSELVAELKEKLKQLEVGGVHELEQENEALKERVGELEVDLDNAVKGREGDTVEFNNLRSHLQLELQALQSEREEAQRTIQGLRSELAVAESSTADERAQREEILRLCAEHLLPLSDDQPGDPQSDSGQVHDSDATPTKRRQFRNVDHLAKVLRSLSHGGGSVELAKAQSSVNHLEAERRALQKSHEADIADLQHQLDRTAAELASVQKKFKKAKELLYEERELRKQLAEQVGHIGRGDQAASTDKDLSPSKSAILDHSTSNAIVAAISTEEGSSWRHQRQVMEERHAREIEALKLRITELFAERDNNPQLVEAEEALVALRAERDAEVQRLRDELAATRAALVRPSESDSTAVAQLKGVIQAQQPSSDHQRAQISRLEGLVESLKENQRHLEMERALRSNSSGPVTDHRATRRRKASSVSPASGDNSAPTELQRTPKQTALVLDEVEARLHKEQRDALRFALDSTATQRNQLLQDLGRSDALADAADHIAQLTKENDDLRQRFLQASARRDDEQFTAYLNAMSAQLQDAQQEDRIADGEKEASNLRAQLLTLQEHLDATRREAAEKEAALMKLVERSAARQSTGPRVKPQPPTPPPTYQRPGKEAIPIDTDTATAHDEGAAVEDENPLVSLVQILQREKAQLLADASRMERELLLRAVEVAAAAAGSDELQPTATAVTDDNAARTATDGRRPSQTADVLRRSGSLAQIVGQEQLRLASEVEELRLRSTRAEAERSKLTKDVESLRAELEEEREQRSSVDAERQDIIAAVKKLRQELADSEMKRVAAENLMNEQQAEVTRAMQTVALHDAQVEELEGRLAERSHQLSELRSMLAQQKSLFASSQERTDELATQVKELHRVLQERDRQHALSLQEREEAMMKATNRRIEALAEEHQRDLARKDEDVQKMRKKLRKLENQLQKAKEKYDEKVCEFEELSNVLEEQKVEAMRLLLKQTGQTDEQVLEVQDRQEQIQSSLQRAKDEQRRKKDKFAMGETTSALANVRAAGNAINLVKKMGQVVSQPPGLGSSLLTTTTNDEEGARVSGRHRSSRQQFSERSSESDDY